MSENKTVYIIDDDAGIRDSLNMLMKSSGIPSVTYPSATAFLNDIDHKQPDCLVTDVRMPGMSGIELQKALKDRRIDCPIIFITGHGDIAMAVDAMKNGALDFLEKPVNSELLISRIRECINIKNHPEENRHRIENADDLIERLSTREREVMELLVEGKINKVIATELGISVHTVEAHRARIMEKLQANSLSDVVKIALSA